MKKTFIILLILTCNSAAQTGVINSYYLNKNLRESLSFVDNVLDGTSYWFYENGNIKEEKTYSSGKLNGWIKYYYENGLLKEEHYVRDAVRDGIMKSFYENGALKEVRTYENGRLIKRVNLGYDSLYVPSLDDYVGNRQKELRRNRDLFLCQVEVCPRPAEGIDAIQKNLVYPEYAKLYGLEGEVSVIAKIDMKGGVKNVRVVKGLGLGCDEAAVEAVMKTRFLPGAENGSAVEADVIFKVKFQLDDKDKKLAVLPDQKITAENTELREMLESPEYADKNEEIFNSQKTEDTGAESPVNFDCKADICPEPIGGLNSILENLVLPKRVVRLKLNGEVVVEADVDKYGLVRDTKVLKGIGYGADDAVEVAILSTLFNPGKINSEDVRTKVVITVPVITDKTD
ncbi:MAG: TonB family protein [Melioribacteraceae bacterium]|nr:TonB family protein [Melioribacteraceae bacterium]